MSARSLVPPQFLFRYSFPVLRRDELPKKGRALLDLPPACALAAPSVLTGVREFADLRVAWNPRGLGIAAHVRNGGREPDGDSSRADESDGLQVWIDTRNTQSVHRATRFCAWLCLLPSGFGPDRDQPGCVPLPIARAREDAAVPNARSVRVAASMTGEGYRLEAWIPGEILTGWDPESNPRLGFYSLVRDEVYGEQPLTVDREFPYAADPSLWCTLDLKSAAGGSSQADPDGNRE